MEEMTISCKSCGQTDLGSAEEQKHCRLCDEIHCDECLNEAGYCAPCSEKIDYGKDEAIAV